MLVEWATVRVRYIKVEKETVHPLLPEFRRQKGAVGSRSTIAGSNYIFMNPSTSEYWVKLREIVKLVLL
jgi:hypothetical protein